MKRKLYITAVRDAVSGRAFPVAFSVLALFSLLFAGASVRGGRLEYYAAMSNWFVDPELCVVILATVLIPRSAAGIFENQFFDVEKTTRVRIGSYLFCRILGHTTVLWGAWNAFSICTILNHVWNNYSFVQFGGKAADLWLRFGYSEFLIILPCCFCMAAVATVLTVLFRKALPVVVCLSAWIIGLLSTQYLKDYLFVKLLFPGLYFSGFIRTYKSTAAMSGLTGGENPYSLQRALLWTGYVLLIAVLMFFVGCRDLKKRNSI